MLWWYAFFLPLLLSIVLTIIVRWLSRRFGVLDRPEVAPERKWHSMPTPLLGGVAIFSTLVVSISIMLWREPSLLLGGFLLPKHLVGILLAGFVLTLSGIFDDIRPQSPRARFLFIAIAAAIVIGAGVDVEYLSNPFGNALALHQWSWTLFTVEGTPYRVVFLADLFALLWLLATTFSTKLLDGLDGLVSGITVIGMLILFFLSQTATVGQPETAALALTIAACYLGFLLFNFHPASIFLGESGATLAGFLLGTLAILSGGKIATALLILGIPMLDVAWIIVRRIVREHRSFTLADRQHLHFRLVDMGIGHRNAVLLLYLCTATFGSATLFVDGKAKAAVLGFMAVVMVLLGTLAVLVSRRRHRETSGNSRKGN